MTPEWISLTEFARRRGVVLAAVQKAIKSKRVTSVKRDETGRLTAVEFHAASAEWAANTDPTEAARSGNGPLAVLATPAAGAQTFAQAQPDLGLAAAANDAAQAGAPEAPAAPESDAPNANEGYLRHREKTEEFRALSAERDYLESIGALVSAADVSKAAFGFGRVLREQLMSIPDRLAPQLAAEREPAVVHALITKELKQALNELASRSTHSGVAPGAT